MAEKIWTQRANKLLFQLLQKQKVNGVLIGQYTPLWSSIKPPHVSSTEMDIVYDDIYKYMKKANVFGRTAPNSSRAIAMQVACCLHPYDNFDIGCRPLRLTAYVVGFMTMSDICYLEQKLIEKHITKSKVLNKS